MPVAQLVQTFPADPENGIPVTFAGQAGTNPPRLLERWHARLCEAVAAQLKGEAFGLRQTTNPNEWKRAAVMSDRARQWDDLSARVLGAVTDPAAPIAFEARDVELVRFHRLVLVRCLSKDREERGARTQQLDHLFHCLYAELRPFERAKVEREMRP